MDLVEKDGFANLTVDGAFYLQLVDDVGAMVAATKKLPTSMQAIIVRDAGFEAPEGMPKDILYYSAASIVQNAWYTATKGKVPDNIVEGHTRRMQRHVATVKEFSAKVPPPPAKAPKTPKKPRKPKATPEKKDEACQ